MASTWLQGLAANLLTAAAFSNWILYRAWLSSWILSTAESSCRNWVPLDSPQNPLGDESNLLAAVGLPWTHRKILSAMNRTSWPQLGSPGLTAKSPWRWIGPPGSSVQALLAHGETTPPFSKILLLQPHFLACPPSWSKYEVLAYPQAPTPLNLTPNDPNSDTKPVIPIHDLTRLTPNLITNQSTQRISQHQEYTFVLRLKIQSHSTSLFLSFFK